MAGEKETLKELLQKKSLFEIETMITEQKRHMGAEKNLIALQHLSSDLSIMQAVRDQKQKESGRIIRKCTKSSEKPELKSFKDYMKSKK
jgi:oligoribonuclease (3'-5' exoribonuclease)